MVMEPPIRFRNVLVVVEEDGKGGARRFVRILVSARRSLAAPILIVSARIRITPIVLGVTVSGLATTAASGGNSFADLSTPLINREVTENVRSLRIARQGPKSIPIFSPPHETSFQVSADDYLSLPRRDVGDLP